MARGGNVRVRIAADTRDLDRGLKRSERALDGTSKRMGRIGAAIGGAFAVTGAVRIIEQSVEASIRAEVSQKKLEAQLKASGIAYRAHAKDIDEVIKKTSRLSALDDEDLKDAFTNIVRVTGDVDKGLRLTGLAADFARAKHIDVAKAGEIVGKVAGGNTGILARYGLSMQKGATATEALGVLQKKFGGQAKAYGETTAGSLDRMKVSVENLQEKVGGALAPTIADAADGIAKFARQMEDGTGAGGRFVDKLAAIWGAVKPVITTMRDLAKKVGEFAGHHPAVAKLAFQVLAVGTAIKLIKWGSAISGLSSFLGAAKALGKPLAARFAAMGTTSAVAFAGGEGLTGAASKSAMRSAGLKLAAFAFAGFIAYEIGKKIGEAIRDPLKKALAGVGQEAASGILKGAQQSNPRVHGATPAAPTSSSTGSLNPGGRLGTLPKPKKPKRAKASAHASGVTAHAASARYGNSQLQRLWISAGGAPGEAPTAAAIAQAESAGDPNARGVNTDGSIDSGLWQINTVHGWGEIYDPRANASRAVFLRRRRGNFEDWVTYNSGAYRRYLTAASSPTAGASGGSPSSAAAVLSRVVKNPHGASTQGQKTARALRARGQRQGMSRKTASALRYQGSGQILRSLTHLPAGNDGLGEGFLSFGGPSGMAGSELAAIDVAWARAGSTDDNGVDDAAVAKRYLAYYTGRSRLADRGILKGQDAIDAYDGLAYWRSFVNQPAAVTEDQQARVDQADMRAAVAQRAQFLSDSFVKTLTGLGDLGSGSPIVNINTLHPGDPATLRAVAAAAAGGFGMQGYVQSPRTEPGL